MPLRLQVASGVGYGAIGGATSALIAPALVSAAGGAANLTDGQRAAIVGAATLLGGVAAGALGQNAVGGASAATNESLNNSTNPLDELNARTLIPLEGGPGGGRGSGGGGDLKVGEFAEALTDGIASKVDSLASGASKAATDVANWVETKLGLATTPTANNDVIPL